MLLELDVTVDRCSHAAALRIKPHKVTAPCRLIAIKPLPSTTEKGQI
jgi:hypothetical protein